MIEETVRRWDRTSFYLNKVVYYAGFTAAALFMLSFMIPVLFTVASILLTCTAISVLFDAILLYQKRYGVNASRTTPERLSNGDENKILLELQNQYDFKIVCKIIDELPMQFQDRDWKRVITIPANEATSLVYFIKPQERGEYHFGNINVYVEGPLRLIKRRYILKREQSVKVYPSYIQVRSFR